MTRKNYTISFLRFLALVLLLACHIFEMAGYNFHRGRGLGIFGNYCAVCVQLFLIISGFLYGCRENLFKENNRFYFVYKNFKKILLDYYVYLFLFLIPVYHFFKPGELTSSFYYKTITFSGVIWGIQHFWYIPYILFCYLITPFLYDLRECIKERNFNLVYKLILLILGIVLTEVFFKAYRVYFNGAWVICYSLAFFLNDFINMFSKKSFKFVALVFLILGIVSSYYRYIVRYVLLPNSNGIYKSFYTYYIDYSRVFLAFSIFVVIWYVGKNFIERVPNFIKLVLDFFDKYTYDIFIVHMIFVKGFLTLVNRTPYLTINILLIFLVSIILGVMLNIVSRFISKCLNKAISHLSM